MFKNHLDMIGRNEPVSKKAKFWQSYVRSLKGSDDIRASEPTHRTPRGIFRPLSDFPELHSTTWPYGKSIYDDPIHASDRISVPGYRYNPIHRETYGYSPRAIYPHQYANLDRYRPGLPIYTRGGLAGRILRDLLNPSSSLPLSAITRDPWWWKYPEFRPFNAPYDSWGKSPFFLRDSYLSPVKRTYLWDKHPIRPFAHVY